MKAFVVLRGIQGLVAEPRHAHGSAACKRGLHELRALILALISDSGYRLAREAGCTKPVARAEYCSDLLGTFENCLARVMIVLSLALLRCFEHAKCDFKMHTKII
eukprot:6210505-Pleurochrysis_carterae.AAC.5